ncbi:transporter substrate-binding domain-containing protein [Leptothrix discophora]|uniref:Transporter substrate-binding domain-containing protein n=1 Tax=Leptothrix discophora TaxID=89 RepID=A0ABT9FYA7_LEPDI|nr:transporter substrate-binding domain-containing protein [Leptothrix discophora]MDP4299218.1 transporter substrate-binding domain-containing protein [Leptothrix discophora]
MLKRPVTWLGLLLVASTLLALGLIWQTRTDAEDSVHDLPLRVGYAVEPPYVELDAQGRVGGESAEVLRATLRSIGEPEPVWVRVPFARLIHQLELGRIDVIAAGLFITPERSRRVAFSRPTLAVGTALLVARGNPQRVHALSDWSGDSDLKLAVLEGAAESRQARRHGIAAHRLVRVAEPQDALALLRNGTVAAFALSAPSLRHLARQNADVELIVPTDLGDDAEPGLSAFAWRQGDPRLPAFDAALGRYLGSPSHLKLVQRLGYTQEEVEAAARHVDAPAKAQAIGLRDLRAAGDGQERAGSQP